MGKNKEVEIPVRDRAGDKWIKIIGLVALFTFPLIGTIGKLILNNMDDMGERQTMIIEAINKINISVGVYDGRITRNEKDITELRSFHTNIRNGAR